MLHSIRSHCLPQHPRLTAPRAGMFMAPSPKAPTQADKQVELPDHATNSRRYPSQAQPIRQQQPDHATNSRLTPSLPQHTKPRWVTSSAAQAAKKTPTHARHYMHMLHMCKPTLPRAVGHTFSGGPQPTTPITAKAGEQAVP